MKTKKLASVVKQNGKQARLMTTCDYEGEALRQYVHAGGAIYPMDGFGKLDPDMLLNVMDVTGDERDKWRIDENEVNDYVRSLVMDNASADVAMRDTGVSIGIVDHVIAVLTDEIGAVTCFIDRALLKPVEDERGLTLWWRAIQTHGVIVVKSGFKAVASIAEYDIHGLDEVLTHAARKAMEQRRERESAETNQDK